MNGAPTPDIVHGAVMDYLRHARRSRWALTTYIARRFGPKSAQRIAMQQAMETKLDAMCAAGQVKKTDSARGSVCYLPVSGQPHSLPQLAPNAQDYKALEENYRESLREQNVLRAQLQQARINNQRLSELAMRLSQRADFTHPAAGVPDTAAQARAEIETLSITENLEQTQ